MKHTLVGDRGDFYCSEWEWINKTSSKYEGKKGAFGLFSKPFTFDYALTSKRTVMKPICHLTHAELATKVTYRFFRHSHSLQSDSPRSLLNKPTSVRLVRNARNTSHNKGGTKPSSTRFCLLFLAISRTSNSLGHFLPEAVKQTMHF